MKTFRNVLSMLLIALVMSASALAQSVSGVVVLGDSFSDIGNMHNATGGLLPKSPPYWAGRASNGPVPVEYLAQNLGVSLMDFAWYGAKNRLGKRDWSFSRDNNSVEHIAITRDPLSRCIICCMGRAERFLDCCGSWK